MTLLPLERVAALRRAAVFSAVPDHVLAGVARVASEVWVEAGVAVIQEGDDDDGMLIVVNGRLRVHAGDRLLRELAPGASIGELAILVPDRRSASVTAITPCLLLRLERAVFDELMADHPELARAMIQMLVGLVRSGPAGERPDHVAED